MTMTDEEREEAAIFCSVVACGAINLSAIDVSQAAYRLAWAAFWCTPNPPTWYVEHWAEAEARLRCGWTPGGRP